MEGDGRGVWAWGGVDEHALSLDLHPHHPPTSINLPPSFPSLIQPLSNVLRLLDTHHILSAPVFAAQTSRCVGFISVGDILRAVLGWASLLDDPTPAGRAENLRRAGARLETARVRDIARSNDGCMLLADSEDGLSLLDVVRDGLLRGGGGGKACHRVAVYTFAGDQEDEDEGAPGAGLPGEPTPAFACAPGADPTEVRITGIVSQSDIIRFLARSGCGACAGLTAPLGSIPGLVSAPVVSVPADMPAALAFASLFSSEGVVSEAAILETRGPGAGTLAGALSSADLRGLRPDGLEALAAPVLAYLSTRPARLNPHVAKTEEDVGAGGPAKSPAAWGVRAPDVGPGAHPLRVEVAATDAPLGEVVARLAGSGAHRAYVCDDGRPSGVVSLSDILRVVAAG